jgi:alkylated DNA repair dioxygenase AlkB
MMHQHGNGNGNILDKSAHRRLTTAGWSAHECYYSPAPGYMVPRKPTPPWLPLVPTTNAQAGTEYAEYAEFAAISYAARLPISILTNPAQAQCHM